MTPLFVRLVTPPDLPHKVPSHETQHDAMSLALMDRNVRERLLQDSNMVRSTTPDVPVIESSELGGMSGIQGYPTLIQQYLQQQQMQERAALVAASASYNPVLGGFSPLMTNLSLGSSTMASMAPSPAAVMGDMSEQSLLLYRRLQQQQQQQQMTNTAPQEPSPSWMSSNDVVPNDPYAESGILGPWSATSAGLLGKMAEASSDSKNKKSRKKCKDKPKRPLSAYNIFFKEERGRILEDLPEADPQPAVDGKPTRKRKKKPHRKIGFESLAKTIGQRWQELSPEKIEYYKGKAAEDMQRYKAQMEEYVAKQKNAVGSMGGDDEDSMSESDAKRQKLA